MIGGDMLKGLVPLLLMGVVFLFISLFMGSYILVDKLILSNSIESDKLIIPEIKLIIKDNKIDTIYVYKIK
jgi:hypothetical protein